MALISIKWIGAQAMMSRLTPRKMVKPAASMLIRDLTLSFERQVKKATVVDFGRARASIVSSIRPMQGEVSTNVKYFPYIEEGTSKMEARHMEGSSKMLGEGAFSYTARKFKSTATSIVRKVAVSMERNWRR